MVHPCSMWILTDTAWIFLKLLVDNLYHWWLIRVTLVVDWLFLP